MLKAGVAKVDITPPVGMRMAGFASRVFPALAVHDPLLARALVLDDGERRVGLVSMDIIGIWPKAVGEVREAVSSSLGIAPEALMLAGTHTHSGPTFWDDGTFTDEEKGYWKALPATLINLVGKAAGDLAPARLGAASGWSAIGINRRETVPGGLVVLGRDQFGHFDTEVGLLRVDRADGTPLAGVMNYACHAVCLMGDNYLTSADYPGWACHFLEKALGGDVIAMFYNGACGNVNPREAAVHHGYASGASFSIADRAGRDLANEAARVWKKAAPKDDITIAAAHRQIELPTNPARAIAAAEENLKEAERRASRPREERTPYHIWYSTATPERARQRLEKLKAEGDAPLRCEIQAIRLGSAALLGWPGEVFCELGMDLKEHSPFRPTYVLGYANDSIGYVPTPEAYEEGGYEVESAANKADNAGTVLVEESLSLLNSLSR